MKKIAIITSAALLLTAAVSAQTDTVPKQNNQPTSQQPTEQPANTEQQPVAKVYNDKYNNWGADTYKMQPMPEALTIEKIFPVIGKYEVTNKAGEAATLTVTLDETNKGIVWIEGLPQGKIKATLRKSPATYKIPSQPLGEEAMTEQTTDASDAKDTKSSKSTAAKAKTKELPEGVLVYDKDANVINVCIGCKYNNEDPTVVFTPAEEQEAAAAADETEGKKTSKTKTAKKSTKKVEKVKPVVYSGSKIIEETPATTEQPADQQPQQQQPQVQQ
jgi:hypothetical protein